MDLGCPPLQDLPHRDAAADRAGDRRRLDARLHAVARRSGDRELHHRPGRDHAADPHLFGDAARREAGDQRDLHDHDRGGRARHRRASLLAQVHPGGRASYRAARRAGSAERLGRSYSSPAPASRASIRRWYRAESAGGTGGGRRRRGAARRSGARSPSAPRRGCAALRTASSSGAAAPERRIRLCASGSMIGSSHGPCTTNGSSNAAAHRAGAAVARLAMPLRSRSRAGDRRRAGEREPHRRRLEAHVLDRGDALRDLQIDGRACRRASCRCGIRRRRRADCARAACSSCSTLKPAIAPLRLVRVAVPLSALVSSQTLSPEPSSVERRDCPCPRAGECRTARRGTDRDRRR